MKSITDHFQFWADCEKFPILEKNLKPQKREIFQIRQKLHFSEIFFPNKVLINFCPELISRNFFLPVHDYFLGKLVVLEENTSAEYCELAKRENSEF